MEVFQVYPMLGYVFATLLGLVFGSFANVVIGRLPRMLELQWRKECAESFTELKEHNEEEPPTRFNLAYPASHCPSCGHSIRWYENIPLLSYLFLRGKCSACKTKISMQYPIVEALSGLLALAAVLHFGFNYVGLAYAVLLYCLLILTMIDRQTMLLPDQITLPLLWLGLLLTISILPVSPVDALIGAAAGYLFLWSVFWAFKLITGKEGMGYGDFKLLAVIGAWLGWQALPLVILLSSLVGAVYGIGLIVLRLHEQSKPMPFGPFLAIAGGIALFYAQPIYQWYWSWVI